MAPVTVEPEIRYGAVALVAGHLVAAVLLSFEVGRSLYRSYCALGPAQDTRQRRTQRTALLPVFAALAAVSLASAVYASHQYATLSYNVWANQRGVKVPNRLYGDGGVFPLGENATQVYVAQWLSETPVHLDAVEIAAEKARRFWWGQQVDLALVPWSLLLAIEGRRRNIPLLWCYLSLGQLVSLSFAQNLFFVALLLTPTPLPPQGDGSLPVARYIHLRNAVFPPKPANWLPHPLLYVVIFSLEFCTIALTPLFANTPSLKYLVVGGRCLAYGPLMLHYILPTSWGVQHSHPHEAYGTYTKLFKFVSLISGLLHVKATVVGLAYNAPAPYYHRHSILLPFDTERRTAWERTSGAFGKVLAATADHPVVSRVGWDVLLSALSVGLWASVRAMDVFGILASTVPLFQPHHEGADGLRGTAKAITSGGHAADAAEPSSPRKRGRSRKSKSDAGDADGDAAYEPTPSEAASVAEGDTLPSTDDLVDWESTALVWGLTALGGLGVGSAGVFGGECIAR